MFLLNVLFNLINCLQLPRNSVYCVQQEIEEIISPERQKQAHISHVQNINHKTVFLLSQ